MSSSKQLGLDFVGHVFPYYEGVTVKTCLLPPNTEKINLFALSTRKMGRSMKRDRQQ